MREPALLTIRSDRLARWLCGACLVGMVLGGAAALAGVLADAWLQGDTAEPACSREK